MTFFNTTFFAAFGIFFAAYYVIRHERLQLYALLAFSAWFYVEQAGSIIYVLLASCLITTITSAMCLADGRSQQQKRLACIAGIAANLALLFFYKYGALIGNTIFGPSGKPAGLALFLYLPLPVGISFYIFHGISLVADSYTGKYRPPTPENPHGFLAHIERTLLYLIFFPQLIAGPISKARMFMPQIERKRFGDIDWEFAAGHLIFGYFSKFVIANNLADWTVRAAPHLFQTLGGIDLIFLHLAYTMQILTDFAGYSSLAIGYGALLGYRLPDNFNFPYIARSFSEFWRRWHMSLSSWLRDYLYIPLGGNRKGRLRTYFNLMATMSLGGLWHGASWNFLAWGAGHGAALSAERAAGLRDDGTRNSASVTSDVLKILMVFTMVSLLWVPFRYRDFSTSIAFFDAIYKNIRTPVFPIQALSISVLCAPVVGAHAWKYYAERRGRKMSAMAKAILFGAMLFFTVTNSGIGTPFIYFQF